jgi:hypothetical protein
MIIALVFGLVFASTGGTSSVTITSGTYTLQSSTCPFSSCDGKCASGYTVTTSGSSNGFTSIYRGTDCNCASFQLLNGKGPGITVSQSGTTVSVALQISPTTTCTGTYMRGSVSASKPKTNTLFYLPIVVLAMI